MWVIDITFGYINQSDAQVKSFTNDCIVSSEIDDWIIEREGESADHIWSAIVRSGGVWIRSLLLG